ncbi:sugar-binding protein [Jiangella alkaliphila]|uniref:NPCBM-associated, NEW3 domain of alpha-galactosidase n=1 Tax=Jiangella alkaliphila TaxID=419479 RepID=A0A1H2JUF5_9ACTN|nr:sugar-binding protein [Jiangella alkaliphila]SDU59801.1 NPCBM-associated, NEW3 domain of alpha-galactosidase [Jiangella alkaliphila]
MRAARSAAAAATAALLAATLTATQPVAAAPAASGASAPRSDAVDLDVLFVGAHPDDEAGALAAFGQWNEAADLTAGVITVTRGEGGGNAVGLEEGPELGMLREAEERSAVANAGIENVYNLDELDFFYNASAPLTDQVWGDDALERVVRVVRSTRPEVIVTMNPSPTPGNHGHHQQAARLAVEAYEAAADPEAFPEQLSEEGLSTWRVSRILRSGATGTGVGGSACETTPYTPADPTDRVFGAWQGRTSTETGELWALRERKAQWEYVSQGWAVFPPPPTDPEQNGCDWFTLIASRTPYPMPGTGQTAALQGALLPIGGGLPLGTEVTIDPEPFLVLPGESFEATVTVLAPARKPLVSPTLTVTGPDGWTATVPAGALPRTLRPGREVSVDVVVTAPAGAAAGQRAALKATLATRTGSGSNEAAVEVTTDVRGELAQRPEAEVFAAWTGDVDLPKLESLIAPIASVGVGRTQPVSVEVSNDGAAAASGSVALDLADGFTASPASAPFDGLAPGATTTVTFDVTNTDTALPTSNRAPNGGYPFQIVTDYGSGTDTQNAVLELVPSTQIPQVSAEPVLDGVASEGEYPGEVIDSSTMWEGQAVPPADASSTTRLAFTDDALYVLVEVTDDTLGTVLPLEDCKRHWRTDSVEITVDPRGTSSNTSTTFKTGIFPTTVEGEPCFQRDADNHQGPGAETAPGMEVASVVNEPYDGYTVEAKIPFDVLPDAVDPARMGLNVLVYDSDTQDKTGQTRIGWSTFNGVQADPFRWSLATLPGLAAAPSDPVAPTMPDTAALSVDSPQSIAQSAADGVGLGGGPELPARTASITSARETGGEVEVRLRTRESGRANVFLWDGESVAGSVSVDVGSGRTTVDVPVTGGSDDLTALVAFITDDGTLALAEPVD